ncbi:MAG: recombinase family protein, partial [Eubacteriales bacterium]
NMINEAYSMDIGKKIKAQQEQAIKDGQFVGAKPPYGYKKSPNDCHKLIVNEDTAPIVKRIFEMASTGTGLTAICLTLNAEKIPTAGKYNFESGIDTSTRFNGIWNTRTIGKLIQSETYLGHLVQGRSTSFNRKQTQKDKSEWVKVENTHEAIISQELFDKVQKVRNKKSVEYKGDWSENIFKGKIFCGHCGKNLHRQKDTRVKTADFYYFKCISNYRIHKGYCNSGRSVKEETISQIVLDIIEKQSAAIFGISLSMKKQSRDIDKRLKSQSDELSLIAKDIDKHRKYLKSLYENLASGIIDVTEYKVLKQGYEEKIETARTYYFELEIQVKTLNEQIYNLQSLDNNLKTVNKKAVLTREIIENLIEKIVVFDKDNIEIIFKFSNSFPLLKEVLGDE